MALIVCPHCNKQISDQGSFCNFCGNPIRAVEPPETIPEETLDQMQIDEINGADQREYKKEAKSTGISKKVKYEVQTFDIYDQEIVCTSSYVLYREIKLHYDEEKENEKLFDKLWFHLPKSIKAALRDENIVRNVVRRYTFAIESYAKKANHRINEKGGRIPEDQLGVDVKLLADFLEKYLNYYAELVGAASDNIMAATEHYWNETRSQVTGLNYGMIGDGMDMMLYSLDNFFTTRKQLKKADAEYNYLKNTHIENVNEEVDSEIESMAKKVRPSFKQIVNNFIEQLCLYEINELEKAGIISRDISCEMDPKKANNYYELVRKNNNVDQNLAIALKYDPANEDVYSELVNRDMENEVLRQLSEFIGTDEVLTDKIIEKIQQRDGNDILGKVKTIEEKKNVLGEDGFEFINNKMAHDYADKLCEVIKSDTDNPMEPLAFCNEKYGELNSQELVDYFRKYDVIVPGFLGESWDKDSILNEVVNARKREVKKAAAYEQAVDVFYKAKTIEEYQEVIELFKKFNGYGDSKDYIEESEYWVTMEEDYQVAIEEYKNATEASEFFEVKDKLEDLEDYKDSEKLAAECQRKIEELNQKERMQMEAEEASKKKFIKWRK